MLGEGRGQEMGLQDQSGAKWQSGYLLEIYRSEDIRVGLNSWADFWVMTIMNNVDGKRFNDG